MDYGISEQNRFIGPLELPVLDPPPGFEDISPVKQYPEDHYYDDPYSDDEGSRIKPALQQQAVSKFASQMAHSLVAAVMIKPRVKMRKKKSTAAAPASVQISSACLQQDFDVYSVPIDNLASGGSDREDKASRKESPCSLGHHTRHSIAVPRAGTRDEPAHMTLDEVRSYLREFQDTSRRRSWMLVPSKSVESTTSDSKRKSCFVWTPHLLSKNSSFDDARTKRSRKSLSVTAAGIKQALFSVFRLTTNNQNLPHLNDDYEDCPPSDKSRSGVCQTGWTFSMPGKTDNLQHSAGNSPHQRRALPPLPQEPTAVGFVRVPSRQTPVLSVPSEVHHEDIVQHLDLASSPNCFDAAATANPSASTSVNCHSEGSLDLVAKRNNLDFAASIEAVKDHGWYWGPLSGEAAEQILSSEPDGSFLVRDSSDDHYIFSLSFKLNGGVRHVRIEHDHGIIRLSIPLLHTHSLLLTKHFTFQFIQATLASEVLPDSRARRWWSLLIKPSSTLEVVAFCFSFTVDQPTVRLVSSCSIPFRVSDGFRACSIFPGSYN